MFSYQLQTRQVQERKKSLCVVKQFIKFIGSEKEACVSFIWLSTRLSFALLVFAKSHLSISTLSWPNPHQKNHSFTLPFFVEGKPFKCWQGWQSFEWHNDTLKWIVWGWGCGWEVWRRKDGGEKYCFEWKLIRTHLKNENQSIQHSLNSIKSIFRCTSCKHFLHTIHHISLSKKNINWDNFKLFSPTKASYNLTFLTLK